MFVGSFLSPRKPSRYWVFPYNMHGQKSPVRQIDGSAQEQRPCCHEPPLIACGLGVNVLTENCEGSVDGGTMAMFVLCRLGRLGVVGVKGLRSGTIGPVGSSSGIGGCFTGSGDCGS